MNIIYLYFLYTYYKLTNDIKLYETIFGGHIDGHIYNYNYSYTAN